MLLMLGACDSSPTDPSSERLSRILRVSSASVAAGEPVTLTFTVTNLGRSPAELSFGSSCMADLSVVSGGTVVWNSLSQYLCLTAVTSRTLAPGESLVFEEIWNQTTNDGARVSPGSYRVFGKLLSQGEPSSSDVMLTIR